MMQVINKTRLMELVIHRGLRESFEHSILGTFDITGMRQRISGQVGYAELHTIDLADIIPHIRESRVVEPERVAELTDYSWRFDPGIFLVIPEETPGAGETHCMIDGHHRAIRRENEGATDMQCFFVPLDKALRPSAGWVKNPWYDWGDKVENGKIILRT